MNNLRTILSCVPALALIVGMQTSCNKADNTSVTSPDGGVAINLGINDGKLFYTVKYQNYTLIDTSYLSINTNVGVIGKDVKLVNSTKSSFDETWEQVWGEERFIRNNYNGLTAELEQKDGIRFSIDLRAYNDGVALRYVIPEQESLKEFTITDENTEFSFSEDAIAWSIPWNHEYYEHLYIPTLISKLDTVATPVTFKMTDSIYAAVHEANLTDYASMNLAQGNHGTKLTTYLTPWSTGEKVFTKAPMSTPWRMIIVGKSPADIALSRMMLNLNDPCKIEDTSWIEPGRYIGIWWGMHMKDYTWCQGPKHGATTENTKRYIDFAAENGFSGVLVEGWNEGWDGDWSANGDKFNFTKAYPDYDIEWLCNYAKSKGVRIIGHNETGGAAKNYENQLDSAFSMYQRLGINAVKTGYVNYLLDNKELHGSQYGVRHYRKVIETAARYHIMIDNHEPVMPTGLQRTYPNLMTQEGVRGQEYDAWSPDGGNPPEHTCTLPFTRGIAGPMDFTPGTFNFNNTAVPTTHPQTTIAKQLALAVVIYSPLQMASDKIENYTADRKEFEFLKTCPTNWDKTLIPEAKIGEYVTFVRKDRNSDDWFVGSITDSNPHHVDLNLSFLDANCKYIATIYTDGENADYRTNPYPVNIMKVNVTSKTKLPLDLAASGGAAIRIHKL
jgi:alpha-glucosidase